MNQPKLASERLKNVLTDRIKNIYQQQLNHQLSEISYHTFEKTLIIILEGTVTQPEQLLNHYHYEELAQQVRSVLDQFIHPQIKAVIEEVMRVKVVDFLSDTAIDTSRTGAIAILN